MQSKGIAMFKMLTFAAFGGIGYAAYSFYQKNGRVPKVNELVETIQGLTASATAKKDSSKP